MAKAREVPLDPGEPFAVAAASVVRARTEELFEHGEGVLDISDIERVHAMRVATRRLRAVLEIFRVCFEPQEYGVLLEEVKRLADALGERRDPDVHLEAFAGRDDIAPLVERLEARQAEANTALAATLAHLEEIGLRERLLALADAAEGPR